MWRRLDVWKKYVQILVFQFIKKKKKDNWLIGIAKEKAGLPCHLTPTHKHQVLNLLKGNSGQNLNVWASLLLSPQLTPVLNLSFLMRYYVQVVSLLLSVNMMSFHYCYKVNYLIVFVIKKKKNNRQFHDSMLWGYMPVWEGVRAFPWAADLWAETWRSQPDMMYERCLIAEERAHEEALRCKGANHICGTDRRPVWSKQS